MPEIKGWCPGALKPMASGDGLLMRAKIVGSKLALAQAEEIAAIASECGNGLLDLSQRAQLQMRGLSEATRGEAQARLARIGLLAPSAALEAVLNVIASPLPCGELNADALATRLAQAIASDSALQALPGKFLFLVDNGGALGLSESDADIRLEAQGARVAVVLDGARDLAHLCDPDDAIDAALALAQVFLTLRAARPLAWRRMRALVAERGAPAVFHEAGLAPTPYASRCGSQTPDAYLSAHVVDGVCFAGVAAPFGRLRASSFDALVRAALCEGASELRLTPWRALLAPVASLKAADRIVKTAQDLGFITQADDWRLDVAACPGAPECPQALGATRMGLEALAAFARGRAHEGVVAHVSGCAKGCAKPSRTPITLVANGAGFDLVFDGLANDTPAATGLALNDIARLVAAHLEKEASCPAH
ncbi:MAG TPA: precorrin-3B synthase [Methylocystis sp.]|nr:precorrin-3B synthase [Methylocystis sp.]